MTPWIFSDLYRPQYPPTPDVLQSALAWSFFAPAPANGARGFIYYRESATQPKRVQIVSTRPDIPESSAWISALRGQGLFYDGGPVEGEVAHAAANALVGIEPLKGTGNTAAPLGLAAALLQDPSGAMGVANPPNFAALINQIYLMGSPSSTPGRASTQLASELWFQAVTKIAKGTDLLRALDAALFHSVIKANLDPKTTPDWPPGARTPNKTSVPDGPPKWWTGSDFDPVDTPFGWFADSWKKLCSDEWILALPPRRWTDWASCLIRQALAFSFLWEAHFFRVLGRFVAIESSESPETAAARIRSAPMGLIPWATAGSIATLDIKPRVRDLLRTGLACRAAFWEWQASTVAPKDKSLIGMLNYMRQRASKALRKQLVQALDGNQEAGGLRNLIETVEYSLLCRRDTGRSADFYGFTKTISRRFTHVAPSPEWIVVISSVAAPGPSVGCRLADVIVSLQRLGLQPRIDTLVRELERAGLCASAPDGDEGILVSPAFGG